MLTYSLYVHYLYAPRRASSFLANLLPQIPVGRRSALLRYGSHTDENIDSATAVSGPGAYNVNCDANLTVFLYSSAGAFEPLDDVLVDGHRRYRQLAARRYSSVLPLLQMPSIGRGR